MELNQSSTHAAVQSDHKAQAMKNTVPEHSFKPPECSFAMERHSPTVTIYGYLQNKSWGSQTHKPMGEVEWQAVQPR